MESTHQVQPPKEQASQNSRLKGITTPLHQDLLAHSQPESSQTTWMRMAVATKQPCIIHARDAKQIQFVNPFIEACVPPRSPRATPRHVRINAIHWISQA